MLNGMHYFRRPEAKAYTKPEKTVCSYQCSSLGKLSLNQRPANEKKSIYHFARVHSGIREGVLLIRAATRTHSLTPVQGINEPKGKSYMTLKFIRCRNMFSHETKANKSIIQGTREPGASTCLPPQRRYYTLRIQFSSLTRNPAQFWFRHMWDLFWYGFQWYFNEMCTTIKQEAY